MPGVINPFCASQVGQAGEFGFNDLMLLDTSPLSSNVDVGGVQRTYVSIFISPILLQ